MNIIGVSFILRYIFFLVKCLFVLKWCNLGEEVFQTYIFKHVYLNPYTAVVCLNSRLLHFTFLSIYLKYGRHMAEWQNSLQQTVTRRLIWFQAVCKGLTIMISRLKVKIILIKSCTVATEGKTEKSGCYSRIGCCSQYILKAVSCNNMWCNKYT